MSDEKKPIVFYQDRNGDKDKWIAPTDSIEAAKALMHYLMDIGIMAGIITNMPNQVVVNEKNISKVRENAEKIGCVVSNAPLPPQPGHGCPTPIVGSWTASTKSEGKPPRVSER